MNAEFYKMYCPKCGGGFEYPAHGVGELAPCPHSGVAGFHLPHLFHHKPPSALGVFGIAVLQVYLGDLQIYGWLFAGFVQGIGQAPGGLGVSGFEALPFFGEGVEGIINTVFTTEVVIALLHGSCCLSLSQPRSDMLVRSGCLVDT
jgi:hypothetical protein